MLYVNQGNINPDAVTVSVVQNLFQIHLLELSKTFDYEYISMLSLFWTVLNLLYERNHSVKTPLMFLGPCALYFVHSFTAGYKIIIHFPFRLPWLQYMLYIEFRKDMHNIHVYVKKCIPKYCFTINTQT